MPTKNLFVLIFFFCFASAALHAETTCQQLIRLKQTIYGFKPSELNDSLKNLKSAELDEFWSAAKAHPADAALCLKSLIENEEKDQYFCFDAASLLVRLDTTDRYLPSVIAGLKKCNLRDLQLVSYLEICCYLAFRGKDIGELAENFISTPGASVYLEQHVITLDAIDASIFMFNLMDEAVAERILTSAILHGNSIARHNASVLLNLMATDSGDRLIDSLSDQKFLADSTKRLIKEERKSLKNKSAGTISRSKIMESLDDAPYNMEKEFFGFAGNDNLIASACKVLSKNDLDKVREARKKSTPGLSDEALHEYYTLSSIIRTIRNENGK